MSIQEIAEKALKDTATAVQKKASEDSEREAMIQTASRCLFQEMRRVSKQPLVFGQILSLILNRLAAEHDVTKEEAKDFLRTLHIKKELPDDVTLFEDA